MSYFKNELGQGQRGGYFPEEGWRISVSGAGAVWGDGLTATQYEAWLQSVDPITGEARGRRLDLGETRLGLRAYEFGVNVPKSLAVAAGMDVGIKLALIEAQKRAAGAALRVMREQVRVRVTVDGATLSVAPDELDVQVFPHAVSREGEPHLHLHVQIAGRARLGGTWYSLAGLTVRNQVGTWNAVTEAMIAADGDLAKAVAVRGWHLDAGGAVRELVKYEAPFSTRTADIAVRREELIVDYVSESGRRPGAEMRLLFDRMAWEQTRRSKSAMPEMTATEIKERLEGLGFEEANNAPISLDVSPASEQVVSQITAVGWRDLGMLEVYGRGAITRAAARAVAASGIKVTDPGELIGAVAVRLGQASVEIQVRGELVLTSPAVLAASKVMVGALRGIQTSGLTAAGAKAVDLLDLSTLTPGQTLVAQALAGGASCVVEGAAGTGKTTALQRALAARTQVGLETFGCAPSAQAVKELGEGWTRVDTAHGLLARSGWSTGADGTWRRDPSQVSVFGRGALVVVDEAAMTDIHVMSALVREVKQAGAGIALVGDSHQLQPVGAAGGFQIAADRLPGITMDEAVRFVSSEHAAFVAEWRGSEDLDAVLDTAIASGVVVLHDSQEDALVEVAKAGAHGGALVMAADNATCATLNDLIRAELEHAGGRGGSTTVLGMYSERIGVGDLVQTRSNDKTAGIRNRDRWTVREVPAGGGLVVQRASGVGAERTFDADLVAASVHRADAVTVHAAQGRTTDVAAALVDSTWTREQAYVALTRAKFENRIHLVAGSSEEARDVLREVLGNDEQARSTVLRDVMREFEPIPGMWEAMRVAQEPVKAAPRPFSYSTFNSNSFGGPTTEIAPPPARDVPSL